MRGKPNPWGIKLYLLCGESGLVYNFLLYQGSTTELDENIKNKYGLGGTVVFELTVILKKKKKDTSYIWIICLHNLIYFMHFNRNISTLQKQFG